MTTTTNPIQGITRREWISGALWAVVRVWVGWQFMQAGLAKVGDPAWTGRAAGGQIRTFLAQATSAKMTKGPHPNVLGPFAWVSTHAFLPNALVLSYLVTAAELIVGAALLLGLCTRLAALGGACLNLLYLLGGSIFLNPLMFAVEWSIVLVGGTAGLLGLDLFLLLWWRERMALPRARSGRPLQGRPTGRWPLAS